MLQATAPNPTLATMDQSFGLLIAAAWYHWQKSVFEEVLDRGGEVFGLGQDDVF